MKWWGGADIIKTVSPLACLLHRAGAQWSGTSDADITCRVWCGTFTSSEDVERARAAAAAAGEPTELCQPSAADLRRQPSHSLTVQRQQPQLWVRIHQRQDWTGEPRVVIIRQVITDWTGVSLGTWSLSNISSECESANNKTEQVSHVLLSLDTWSLTDWTGEPSVVVIRHVTIHWLNRWATCCCH